MRVMDTLRVLFIVALGLCLLASAAGAIYIEGQPIPDDGMYHILSAEDGSSGVVPSGIQGDVNLPLDTLPAYVWDEAPLISQADFSIGFPTELVTDGLMMPSIPGEETVAMPGAALPSSVTNPDSGTDAGSSVQSGLPGYINPFDAGSMFAGMPAPGGLFF